MSGLSRAVDFSKNGPKAEYSVVGISPRRSNRLRLGQWITQDYRVVRVCEMTDNHLLNCIRYVLRNAPRQWFEVGESRVGPDPDDIARWWGEKESWTSMVPNIVKDMVAEATDRGLEVEMNGNEYRHVTTEALTKLFGGLIDGYYAEKGDYKEVIVPGGRKMTAEEISEVQLRLWEKSAFKTITSGSFISTEVDGIRWKDDYSESDDDRWFWERK